MKYNKSKIMKRAHEIRKTICKENIKVNGVWVPVRFTMSEALRMAWQEAKIQANSDPQRDLFILEMKDRWDESDFDYARQLRQQISAAAA